MSSLRRTGPILAVAAAVLLAGCGGGGGKKSETAAGGRAALDPSKTYTVTLQTNEGVFSFDLDVKDSPNTTASFAALVKKGFFDGLTFHRIVPGFVIQGGDPNGDGTGGPGYTTVDVPPSDAAYTRGVVAMAKGGAEPPGTSGSQFFVVTGPDVGLPADYALLGKVTKGLDVVEKIGRLGDATEQPTKRVVIDKATLTES
jgi:cyclophilin family peptidyl-prolyl cis-trans isomerase